MSADPNGINNKKGNKKQLQQDKHRRSASAPSSLNSSKYVPAFNKTSNIQKKNPSLYCPSCKNYDDEENKYLDEDAEVVRQLMAVILSKTHTLNFDYPAFMPAYSAHTLTSTNPFPNKYRQDCWQQFAYLKDQQYNAVPEYLRQHLQKQPSSANVFMFRPSALSPEQAEDSKAADPVKCIRYSNSHSRYIPSKKGRAYHLVSVALIAEITAGVKKVIQFRMAYDRKSLMIMAPSGSNDCENARKYNATLAEPLLEIETWIEAGRITVDGKKIKLGERLDLNSTVKFDGRTIPLDRLTDKKQVLIYHKPVGEVSTRKDPEGRKTVFDTLPKLRNKRWVMMGRLDINTSGLLLFTTDGELANQITHPSSGIAREYAVRILGKVSSDKLQRLKTGKKLEDGFACFESLEDKGGEGANHWYHVVVREGRNRLVRRLWESEGLKVSRLIRIAFGPIALPRTLRMGQWRALTSEEIEDLYTQVFKSS